MVTCGNEMIGAVDVGEGINDCADGAPEHSTIRLAGGVLRPQLRRSIERGLPFPAGIPLRQEIESPQ
jgi:hypothetical protein